MCGITGTLTATLAEDTGPEAPRPRPLGQPLAAKDELAPSLPRCTAAAGQRLPPGTVSGLCVPKRHGATSR